MKVQGVSRKGEHMKWKDVIEVGIMLEKNVKEIMEGEYIEGSAQKCQMPQK